MADRNESLLTSPASADATWRAFDATVRSRRAVRKYEATPVAAADMRDILDAALLAPTSSNLQPFELVWVRDPVRRAALVRACLGQPAAATAAELVVCIARWDRCEETRREIVEHLRRQGRLVGPEAQYWQHLVRLVYEQGPFDLYGRLRTLVGTPIALAVPLPRGPASRADVRTWAQKSTALVAQTLMLAARAKGLDTCPLEGCDPVRVGKVVDLPPRSWKRTWDLSMVIAIGHRAADAPLGPRWRRAREKLVREV